MDKQTAQEGYANDYQVPYATVLATSQTTDSATQGANSPTGILSDNMTGNLQGINNPVGDLKGGQDPGGSDTQVQYNNGGSFGGDANLIWNKNQLGDGFGRLFINNDIEIGATTGGTTPTLKITNSGEDFNIIGSHAGTSSGNQGGFVKIISGNGDNNKGGIVELIGGYSTIVPSGAAPAQIVVNGANTGVPGAVSILAGDGVLAGNDGGRIDIDAGRAGSGATGGEVSISAGGNASASGPAFLNLFGTGLSNDGGRIDLESGAGTNGSNGNGGNITIRARGGDGAGQACGDIQLELETGSNSARNGRLIVYPAGDQQHGGILNFDAIANTTTKTFTFQNLTGTVTEQIPSALTTTRIPVASTAGSLTDYSTLTFTPSTGALTASQIIDSGLTSGRITVASTSGQLVDYSTLTFGMGGSTYTIPDQVTNNTGGGGITITSGKGKGNGAGGDTDILGGNSSVAGGFGSDVFVPGAPTDGQDCLQLEIVGASASNGAGGDIYIQPGLKGGSSTTNGQLFLADPTGGQATIDTTGLTGIKKFTFPNQSGIFSTTTSGSGAPGSTPAALGQIYVDTNAAKVYASTGTSSSADWKILN